MLTSNPEGAAIRLENSYGRILFFIVFSQFACTSLWFAGNAIMQDLVRDLHLPAAALGHITSAVQFGFIVGTLSFALLAIADRFSPSKVFFVSALAAALLNAGLLLGKQNLLSLLFFRFGTGFFLAGIYPIGMKIAADYHERGLGKALGYLVGALVLGTAFPHLLKAATQGLPWLYVISLTSLFAIAGGFIILMLVPDGPFRKKGGTIKLKAFPQTFRNKAFRAAAFGYFGHMWELYAFWAYLPLILATYVQLHPEHHFPVSFLSFLLIGIGGLSCIIGGFLSQLLGSKKVAFWALLASGLCCLFSPLAFFLPVAFFLAFLFFWGMVVTADSPQFSTLVAQHAPPEFKGTALTAVNCIGFSITIVSIQLIGLLLKYFPPTLAYTTLSVGPLLGVYALVLSAGFRKR
ncbi:MFS transporter [Nafulsella turpanensis]|uniref:MFS transporter n=1 Tax=Nafulsella turpanensis TaxID=1265690 RepID=UPI00034C3E3B|nr:MFS transporter [Nafulsella turpanensis]